MLTRSTDSEKVRLKPTQLLRKLKDLHKSSGDRREFMLATQQTKRKPDHETEVLDRGVFISCSALELSGH